MNDVTLQIDEVTLETEAGKESIEGATAAIQEAFALLARRLERGPFSRWGGSKQLALEDMSVSSVPLEEILGPRGAERLADEMYNEFLRGLR